MLLSNLTQWYCNKLPEKEAIKMIADAGFDAYDISLFELTRNEEYLFNSPNYVEIAKEMFTKSFEAASLTYILLSSDMVLL